MTIKKKDIIARIIEILEVDEKQAEKIYDKARAGGEFDDIKSAIFWLEERFEPNIIWIDETGYAKMCIDALKILNSTAATDYGSSRQRDFGQMWGDMTRGYLAEYALGIYLKQKWDIVADLGHEQGSLKDYLPSDIYSISKPNESKQREPHIKVGIKGTKWNGIWLDIPGAQFHHSDVHILVKVGVARDHLFAYFKHISVFKDKVLRKGVEVGSLSENEADELYETLPQFTSIPAYIVGFAPKNYPYQPLPYNGKLGRMHYTIKSWNGEILPNDLAEIKQIEKVAGNIKFEGIGNFSHNKGYLFNTGSLLWQPEDWEQHIINRI